jgi:protein gp37
MAATSAIEWTEMTWNPVTGCTKISEGCRFCYAERMAKRLQDMGVEQYSDGFSIRLAPHILSEPFKWRRPRLVFVNSMSDLFHEDVPLEYILMVFDVMRATPQHIYQILTKRSRRLAELAGCLPWKQNMWMGVTVENHGALYRIHDLAETNAHVKFVSFEPLLGPVNVSDLSRVDWVIVGGESGPRARIIKQEWIDSIFDLCRAEAIPFFFKQWGRRESNPNPDDPTARKGHKYYAKGGCQLYGRVYREMPATI